MEKPILFNVENQVAVVTLNRPKKHNSLNQALLAGLYDAIEEIEKQGFNAFISRQMK